MVVAPRPVPGRGTESGGSAGEWISSGGEDRKALTLVTPCTQGSASTRIREDEAVSEGTWDAPAHDNDVLGLLKNVLRDFYMPSPAQALGTDVTKPGHLCSRVQGYSKTALRHW